MMHRLIRLASALALASALMAQQGNTQRPVQVQPEAPAQGDPLGEALGERSPDVNRDPPAYISGKVVMHDGGPTPTHTQVELFCYGFRRFVDTVTGKGEFDLDLSGRGMGAFDAGLRTQNSGGVPQRSALGIVNLNGCYVRAELPGYGSTQIELGMHSIFDNPDVGEVLLTPLEGVTGAAVSAKSLHAPKKAQTAFVKARAENLKEKPNLKKMERSLQSAVGQFAEYAEAWDLLGRTQLGLGKPDEARASFERAIAADPLFTRPYTQLASLLAQSGDLEETVAVGLKALELNPHDNDARFYVTVAQLRLGRNEDAVASARQLIARGAGEYPQAYQLIAAGLANLGKYPEAARYYQSFLRADPDATAADDIRRQLTEWEQLGIVAADETVGDLP